MEVKIVRFDLTYDALIQKIYNTGGIKHAEEQLAWLINNEGWKIVSTSSGGVFLNVVLAK